jgi:RNA polymerase sigma-70 factor (ECF subfamily)
MKDKNKSKGADMEDRNIVELFFKRDQQAIRETDNKYGSYCKMIAGNILKSFQDVEECIDDTYIKLWNKIPPSRPIAFKGFIGKITRELAYDRYRAGSAKKRGGGEIEAVLEELDECIPDSGSVESSIMGNELAGIVSDFVDKLPEKEAYIFLGRYFYAYDIAFIARKFGMTKGNVSVTLTRIRNKLKERLMKEGYLAV